MTNATSSKLTARFAPRFLSAARRAAVVLPVTLATATVFTSACTTEVVNHVVASPEQKGILVTGSGRVLSAPDIAVINIGVETWGDEPKAAVDENTQQTTALVETLKQLGIAPADLQTSNFSIRFERREPQPVWTAPQTAPVAVAPKSAPNSKSVAVAAVEAPPPPQKPKREGTFIVNNTLNVTVRDEQAGRCFEFRDRRGRQYDLGRRFSHRQPRTTDGAGT